MKSCSTSDKNNGESWMFQLGYNGVVSVDVEECLLKLLEVVDFVAVKYHNNDYVSNSILLAFFSKHFTC
jgi:hypothetical protein